MSFSLFFIIQVLISLQQCSRFFTAALTESSSVSQGDVSLDVIHKMLSSNLTSVYDLSQLCTVNDEQDGAKYRALRDNTL